MKDCKDCKYFEGYDYSDGTPCCIYNNGEACPYNVEGCAKEDEFKITLDIPELTGFIKHTIHNTVKSSIYQLIETHVKSIVDNEIKNVAEAYVNESLKKVIDEEIKGYMNKDITIGGGWREIERTLTRNEYLSECISKVLDERLKPEEIKKIVTESCHSAIDSNLSKLKNDVNQGIKKNFDDATRKALSDNVVSMLMAGDTYKRLSDSMGNLLK